MNKCIKNIGNGFNLVYEVNSFKYFVYQGEMESPKTEFSAWVSTSHIKPDDCIINLDWLLTSACNLSCPYCIATDINGFLQLNKVEEIMNAIIALQPLHITLSGGEPTLFPFLTNIIERIPDSIACTIDTNGTNPEIIKKIIPFVLNKKINFRITIDSIDAEIFKITRPAKNKINYLDALFQSIDILQHYKVPVMVHTTVTSINIDKLDGVAYFLESKNISRWKLYKVDIRSVKIQDWGVSKDRFLSQIERLRSNHPTIDMEYDYEPLGESVIIIAPTGQWLIENAEMTQRINIFNGKDLQLEGHINIMKHVEQYIK